MHSSVVVQFELLMLDGLLRNLLGSYKKGDGLALRNLTLEVYVQGPVVVHRCLHNRFLLLELGECGT